MRENPVKKLSLFFLALILLAAPAAAADGDEPPAIEKGWNLISTPCDVSLADIRQSLGSEDIEVYLWNGEEYQQVDSLERARGYAMNSNAVLNTSYICDNNKDDTPVSLSLEKGWNLIGNPFHKAITFNEAFETDMENITVIYEYRGNRFVEIEPDDHLKPWRGYWVYALSGMTITYGTPPACDSLEIGGSVPDPLLPGGTFSLAAECKIGDSALDVTAEAEWRISDADVLSAGEAAGDFKALKAGETTITAAYLEHISNELVITVRSATEQLTKLYLSADRDSIQIHEHSSLWVVGTYSSEGGETRENVTDRVEWVLDDEEIGYVDENGSFTPTALGVVSIYASLDGVKSNSISIAVAEKHLKWLIIYPYPDIEILECPADAGSSCYKQYAIAEGNTGNFEVYAFYNDDSWKSVDPGSVEWELSDSGLIELTESTGAVAGLSEGSVRIRVYMDGVYSEPVWLHVYGEGTEEFLTIEYSNRPVKVKKDKTTTFEAIHYVKNSAGSFDYYEAPFTATRVTKEAEWHITDSSVGSVEAGVLTGLAAGRADIHATHGGLTSNSITIEVWEAAELNACEPDNPNEQTWADGTSLAVLAADCATYGACEPVTIQFTTAIRESSYLSDLDVCLDLYVYSEAHELVKTFRDIGCTPEPLFHARTVEGYRTEYEYSAVWDLADNDGNCVPAGKYYAVSRFYITYCPVIKVEFEITETCLTKCNLVNGNP